MRIFKRFKGMIYPGMAGTFEDATHVRDRKNMWMVKYLRARRGLMDDLEYRRKQALREKSHARTQFLIESMSDLARLRSLIDPKNEGRKLDDNLWHPLFQKGLARLTGCSDGDYIEPTQKGWKMLEASND